MENLYKLEYYKLSKTKWTQEESDKIYQEYNSQSYDIFKLANSYKRTPGCIAHKLKALKLIKTHKDALGYSEYLNSELYKEIINTPKPVKLNNSKYGFNEIKNDIDSIKNDIKRIFEMINTIYEFENDFSSEEKK